MRTIAKITPDDYPDLLKAVDEGVSQRELARQYRCAPSLIARHVAKARRLREPDAVEEEVGADLGVRPIGGSMRAILEARMRDPNTPARDLASLANAHTRLSKDDEHAEPRSSFPFRLGTIILEPVERGPKSEQRYRLMLRERGHIEYIPTRDDDLTAAQAFYLIACWLQKDLGLPLETLGLTSEDDVVMARRD